jgi:crotonobetainyl-CoA:carnitine CoA-transferase CaiB-like acyl-CoA transferase
MTEGRPGPLAHLSVVDLTTARGWLAGKLLADLGATVVRVEPQGGDDTRIDTRVIAGVTPGGRAQPGLARIQPGQGCPS